MNIETSQASGSKRGLHVEHEQNLILLSLWSCSDNTFTLTFCCELKHAKRRTINGVVAKQYDVARWRRYLALRRSILYVELRTGGANTFRGFPRNLGIKRLIFAVKDQIVCQLRRTISFGSLNHYGFAAEVKRNSASGQS